MDEETKNTFVNVDFSNFMDGLNWLEKRAAEEESGNRSAVVRKLVQREMRREAKAKERAEKAVL